MTGGHVLLSTKSYQVFSAVSDLLQLFVGWAAISEWKRCFLAKKVKQRIQKVETSWAARHQSMRESHSAYFNESQSVSLPQ